MPYFKVEGDTRIVIYGRREFYFFLPDAPAIQARAERVVREIQSENAIEIVMRNGDMIDLSEIPVDCYEIENRIDRPIMVPLSTIPSNITVFRAKEE